MNDFNVPRVFLKQQLIFLIRKKIENLFISYIELRKSYFDILQLDYEIKDYSDLTIRWNLLKSDYEKLEGIDKRLINFCGLRVSLSPLNNLNIQIQNHNIQVILIQDIDEVINKFHNRVSDFSDYFTKYQAGLIKQELESVIQRIQILSTEDKFLVKSILRKKIDNALLCSKKFEEAVQQFNDSFIQKELELYKEYFNTYEGRGLNEEQKKATVIQENKVLVNAGAGSGKTSVISARIGYLVKHKKINPKDILLITFTRDGKDNMKKRVFEKAGVEIDARTIHSLGGTIIKEFEGNSPALANGTDTKGFLKLAFDNLLKNSNLATLIKVFYLKFNYEAKTFFDFRSIEDFLKHRKDINDFNAALYDLHSKKQYIPGKIIKTLSGEKVRSFEEKTIADFLFLNGIKFIYEIQYRFPDSATKRFRYQPDFYLPDFDIYIEHFGINRDGSVPAWFKTTHKKFSAAEIYNYQIKKKIELHRENKTTLLATYSYEFKEGVILDTLERTLLDLGVKFSPLDDIHAIKGLESDIINLMSTFLSLFKSGNYDFDELGEKNKRVFEKSEFNRNRSVKFIDIFRPVFEGYQLLLSQHRKIDFSDYVRKSFQYLNEKGELLSKDYKHIIIDEFQDTSFGMMKLVRALDNLAEDKRLFFVGDDWQSIFKFNGADVTLMLNFEEEFNDSRVTKLEYNFRSQPNIVTLGKHFISRNPFQLEKNVKSSKGENSIGTSKEIVFLHTAQLREAFDRIALNLGKFDRQELDFESQDVAPDLFVISRYNEDIEIVKESLRTEDKTLEKLILRDEKFKIYQYKNIKIRFLSVHSSKGLEAKYVMILPPIREHLGFPSSIPDDPILKLVTSTNENYEYAEERRLMYVAMTRAEEQLFFVLDNGDGQTNSPFWHEVQEIISQNRLNEGSEKFQLNLSINEFKEKYVEDMKVSKIVGMYVDLFEGWRGKCPFHSDESESLIVKNENNTFYCPVCREYGDKYQFVERLFNFQGKDKAINQIYEDLQLH